MTQALTMASRPARSDPTYPPSFICHCTGALVLGTYPDSTLPLCLPATAHLSELSLKILSAKVLYLSQTGVGLSVTCPHSNIISCCYSPDEEVH